MIGVDDIPCPPYMCTDQCPQSSLYVVPFRTYAYGTSRSVFRMLKGVSTTWETRKGRNIPRRGVPRIEDRLNSIRVKRSLTLQTELRAPATLNGHAMWSPCASLRAPKIPLLGNRWLVIGTSEQVVSTPYWMLAHPSQKGTGHLHPYSAQVLCMRNGPANTLWL